MMRIYSFNTTSFGYGKKNDSGKEPYTPLPATQVEVPNSGGRKIIVIVDKEDKPAPTEKPEDKKQNG